MPSILISAGEASGEHYGAELIRALRTSAPERQLAFFGLGGEAMAQAGADIVVHSRDVAVVGLFEVLRHLPRIYQRFKRLLAEVDRRKPAAAVLIDFPDFNFRLARALKKRGVPVIYYVSPQLWAWRKWRIRLVRKYVDQMLVIFPFEEEFYRQHSVAAQYVGHGLADLEIPLPERATYARQHGLDPGKAWVALLPGSRRQEIERHLPEMMRAAMQLGREFEYILPVASTIDRDWLAQHVAAHEGMRMAIVNHAREALALSRVSVVASGTATVEAALAGNPFVVIYRVSPLTYALGRPFVRLDHFAMPNLIAGRRIVPELIQSDLTAENIVCALRPLLENSPERANMISGLREVKEKLKPSSSSAARNAAEAVLTVLDRAGKAASR